MLIDHLNEIEVKYFSSKSLNKLTAKASIVFFKNIFKQSLASQDPRIKKTSTRRLSCANCNAAGQRTPLTIRIARNIQITISIGVPILTNELYIRTNQCLITIIWIVRQVLRENLKTAY